MTAIQDRTSEFLGGSIRRRHSITTPEGVQLTIDLADVSERASAFLIDVILIVIANVALVVLVALAFGINHQARLLFALALFAGFLIRHLYFVRFELAWQGVTPGKRLIGLRVIDRTGGPLLPGAIVTRNLTREVECFLPLLAILSAGSGALGNLFFAAWLLGLAFIPLFNKDRRRVGDMLAGTLVMAVQKRVLLPDLVEKEQVFSFSDAQLREYGAFELQVLEEILRRPPTSETAKLLADISTRIRARIAWSEPIPPGQEPLFLSEFYAAQRAHLEREQLFGRARAEKKASKKGPS
jgi:uncharacterized RDD family membrane protein YckC